MKAIVYTQYGSTEHLHLEDVPKPTPKENEVLIQIKATSVNSWDWDMVHGKPWVVRVGAFTKPRHKILGCDVAGVVEAVGAKVTKFKVGDEVFGDLSGDGWGGFAEYVCGKADLLAHKSPSMSFEQAAALGQAAVLAYQGLTGKNAIQPGQKVLVNGAGGGVGTIAIPLLKHYGAEVTAVDSASKLDKLKALGADHVIDYNQTDYTKTGQQYDFILDNMAHRAMADYKRALKPKGRFVMVGGNLGLVFKVVFFSPFIAGNKRLKILAHKPNAQDLDELAALFEASVITPVIDKVYPLSETATAIQRIGDGDVLGKAVVVPSQHTN